MYTITHRYMEECWGAMMPFYETEVFEDFEGEVKDEFINQILANGADMLYNSTINMIDNSTDGDIEVYLSEYVDTTHAIERYETALEFNTDFEPNREQLESWL